ncbi:MAG TPA: hypothetical protein PLT66_03945 [Bacillota bacterium]|nr:hypothetical protein [Bacillota bacterium]
MKHTDIFKYTTIWMDTIRNGAFGLSNTNRLIRFYPGATGMKTGYTSSAGFCVSATAERAGMQVIAVVLGGQTSDIRFSCAKKMMDFAFANYSVVEPEPVELENITVAGGEHKSTPLSYEPPSILTEKGAGEITVRFEIPDFVEAPVKQGDMIGVARFYSGETEVASVPVTAVEDNGRITFFVLLWRILTSFLI